jgi:hypothetical protein
MSHAILLALAPIPSGFFGILFRELSAAYHGHRLQGHFEIVTMVFAAAVPLPA